MPSETYFFKIQTVDRPSRTILDEIKKVWFDEAGVPTDNDGGERQAVSEFANCPLDIPFMTGYSIVMNGS